VVSALALILCEKDKVNSVVANTAVSFDLNFKQIIL